MTVCNSSLPAAMAFCFLEDLRWEFTACFDSATVALAARPYPFLEFGEWQRERVQGLAEHLGFDYESK